MIIPNIWENKNVPNHQPDIYSKPLGFDLRKSINAMASANCGWTPAAESRPSQAREWEIDLAHGWPWPMWGPR